MPVINDGGRGPERQVSMISKEGTPLENLGLSFIENIIEWQRAVDEGNAEKARIHENTLEGLGRKLKEEFGINPESYLDEVRRALENYDILQRGSVASLG